MNKTISGGNNRNARSVKGEVGRRLLSQSLPVLPGSGSNRHSRKNHQTKQSPESRQRHQSHQQQKRHVLSDKIHAAHTEHLPGAQWGHAAFKGLHDWSEADHEGEVQTHAMLYDNNNTKPRGGGRRRGKGNGKGNGKERHQDASLPRLRPQASMSFTLPNNRNGGQSAPPMHRRSHTTLAPQHVCPICTQRFRRRVTLEVHQRILHPWTARPDGTIIAGSGTLPFQCKECGKGFTRREQYFAHKKLHTGGQFLTCMKCDKRMLIRRTENKHARVHISAYPPFDCVCGRRFKSNDSLNEHLAHREVHRPFVCICGHKFRQQIIIKVRDNVRLDNMSERGKLWNSISFV